MTLKRPWSVSLASVVCFALLALLPFAPAALAASPAAARAASPAPQAQPTADAGAVLSGAVDKLLGLVEPAEGQAPQTLSAKLKVVKAQGLPGEAQDATASFAFQAPDRLWVTATFGGETYAAAQNRPHQARFHQPGKKFAL